ncbi:MAG: tRNA (N(6)-L-threonylcarbamoyladenosine(37)-C(2))-methylthiotransferase MtaB [Oscillospiraceae bacterium]|nr:tRNA (N(6)-L-threonylcarbamoyladenosine(37)-C(2))-methylthiotransferase MtaB [Oscillospiraceae bacterium]
MKFAFYTLGCKTNQYETQAMERLLQEKGHEIGRFDEKCDAYIINTCSVTAVADKKNRAMIRRCRRDNPGAVIGVCGCYPQHAAEAVRELGVDVIGGSGSRQVFIDNLLKAVSDLPPGGKVPPQEADEGHTAVCMVDNALRRREFEILPAGGLEERTRAMLKVQDGCVNFCTYCIIPYTRGPIRSAPLELAVEQAKELARRGYREIVITGIEIAGWGADLPGKPPVSELIEAICRTVPELRIRLGSLEPRIVTEVFCEKLCKLPNLCPQFHLSLQSGCDTVLARMKRKYDTARYLESVRLLNAYFPGCAITTDMIVAFPGETEEEFRQSLAFIRKCAFADMHIFPYSRRPGTPADKMPGQHNNATKEARSRAAIAVAEEMSREYREKLIGTRQSVLFEEKDGEFFTGHAPNYVKVYARGENLHNEIREVTITEVYQDGVLGR